MLVFYFDIIIRRGRAGRVQEGRCFRLITANTFQKLPAHSVPEILRVPLENVVLQIKAMPKYASEEASRQLLSRCIDPPTTQAVMQAEQYLMRLQALNKQKELSPLGHHLSTLPCSPNIGRMLIYGNYYYY
jgi:ATP-dependent RNA helicase DHX36